MSNLSGLRYFLCFHTLNCQQQYHVCGICGNPDSRTNIFMVVHAFQMFLHGVDMVILIFCSTCPKLLLFLCSYTPVNIRTVPVKNSSAFFH